ncbi:hypothetical protein N015_19920 [Pseudomonas asturiensis]|uniref:Uncharacterized protein n=1 Tax=Pseudomonas asturiensis TaxID=1190415 RepID=A0ABX6HGV2_9PSED|nr:hypothetical protein N015_19920 [Pseudomonas asturiensis]
MLPRRKTKIQLHSVTVSSAGAEFLYHQRLILFGKALAPPDRAIETNAGGTQPMAHFGTPVRDFCSPSDSVKKPTRYSTSLADWGRNLTNA